MIDPRLSARELAVQDPTYVEDLWLRYWANGGTAARGTFDIYLRSEEEWDEFELRILRWAVEEVAGLSQSPLVPGP